jgi:DNA invertase Pin-like site-specific DNA recombinase
MEDAATQIQAVARKRARAKEAFDRADTELRDLLVEARAGGMGPSEMARLTGFTREWVARIAPEPKR